MYASDIEKDDNSNHTGDLSNATTDDEFFNELMEAPPEFEDRLIPDQCKNEIEGIEHLTKCLNRRFNSYPVVFMGTLKDALKESFGPKDINERRALLIYINNDKSVYTNLFCKQLLCNDKIIEYLMNNYVLWAWDTTFESNGQKLNEFCKNAFAPWTNDKQFNLNAIDQYPLLIGVSRDLNGDYTFTRLIEGSSKKPNVEEFLSILTEYRNKFYISEQELQKAKEEAKQQMLFNLFQSRDINRRGKHHRDREFLRSMSMFPHIGNDNNLNQRNAQFSRLLSGDINMRYHPSEFISSDPMHKDDFMHQFKRFNMDSDDADDEDDDGKTPTVENPTPKFP